MNKLNEIFKPIRQRNILTKAQEDYLHKIYYDDKKFFGRDRLFQYVQAHWNKNNDPISRRAVQGWLNKQNIYQLFKPIRKHVKGNIARTLLSSPWQQVGVDLIDYSKHEYDGYNWILTAIDLFKKAYAEPLENKEGRTVSEAMQRILNKMPFLPTSVRSDNGSEFISKEFKKLLKDNNIKQILSLPHKPQSNGNIERFNRTLKRLLQQYMTFEDNQDWISILQQLIDNYNETVSDTTKKHQMKLNQLMLQNLINKLKIILKSLLLQDLIFIQITRLVMLSELH